MTVSSQVSRADYSGNGSVVTFATGFRFLKDSHLRVILTNTTTNIEVVQVLITDYSVTGAGEQIGGDVVMVVAPPLGYKLTIKRNVPLTQETDYVENDEFPAESHETALDKLTMEVQQQQEEIDRTIKLSEAQTSTGLTIPAPDEGKFLQWDAFGNFINVDILNQGLLIVTAFGQSLIAAADAAAGRLIMNSMEKISSAVTNNVIVFDANDEAKDSGVPFVRFGQAAGLADAITVAFAIPVTVITDGLETRVRALSDNATTTPTASYDGLGAKTIVKNGNKPLAIGDIQAGQELILVNNTANDNAELLNPSPAIVQRVYEQTAAVATGTAVIPFDDTIPQITEGNQFLSASITPAKSTNKLLIEVVLQLTNSGLGAIISAVFRDSEVDAIAANASNNVAGAQQQTPVTMTFEVEAGSTSELTFTVRGGSVAAGTVTLNGESGLRRLGGVMISSINITELLS